MSSSSATASRNRRSSASVHVGNFFALAAFGRGGRALAVTLSATRPRRTASSSIFFMAVWLARTVLAADPLSSRAA